MAIISPAHPGDHTRSTLPEYRCDPTVCLMMGKHDLCPGCRLLARHRERTIDIIRAALRVHRDELRELLRELLSEKRTKRSNDRR